MVVLLFPTCFVNRLWMASTTKSVDREDVTTMGVDWDLKSTGR